MTSPFKHIQENPTKATALIGISYVQFTALVIYVGQHEEEKQQQQELQKKRVNAKGGGRRPKLSKAEGLCLCLFYLRHAPVFEGGISSVSGQHRARPGAAYGQSGAEEILLQ